MAVGNRKKFARAKPRKRRGSAARSLFVDGGFLADWNLETHQSPKGRNRRNGDRKSMSALRSRNSGRNRASGSRNESRKPRRIAFDFQERSLANGSKCGDNHLDESRPILLVDSEETKIFAYIDETPSTKSKNLEVSYDYSTTSALDDTSHRGLGSSLNIEKKDVSSFDTSPLDVEIDANVSYNHETSTKVDNFLAETSSSKENPGFLSIGGMRVYTQDVSDEEGDEDVGEESFDEESSESYSARDSYGSFDSDDPYGSYGSYSGPDVDDEVAEDYFEGIGGIDNVVDIKRLVEQGLDVSGDDDETFDDLMLVNDRRSISARKKRVARFSQSWPSDAQRSIYFRKRSGEKRKHRKQITSPRHRERMIRQGIDLENINMKLQQMVLDGVEILSFQPMHSQDCSKVQRLADIYRLQSACQAYGKKRFVTVMRTPHTCMPSSSDKTRLEKLIGPCKEYTDFTVNDSRKKRKNAAKRRRFNPHDDSSKKASKKRKRSKEKTGSDSAQPVSFVSSGIIEPHKVEITTVDSRQPNDAFLENIGVASSSKCGAFESHTTGFGSKMMAKMGFLEGGGLGKDGQGMAEPIEAIQRPRSLGLGAKAPKMENHSGKNESKKLASYKKHTRSLRLGLKASGRGTDSGKIESKKFASFEKHTKGFGSKLMEKMGFVEGMGLGKDSQGMVNPLVAVRLPKSIGLGAIK